MPRRTATLLASTLILVTLLCAGVLIKVPYAEMSPGPTVNTLGEHGGEPVLSIKGHEVHEPTSGHLNMTTVRVTAADYRMDLLTAVTGWLDDESAVVPYETLYPNDKSAREVDQENAEEFSASQENAKAAALRELGKPFATYTIVSSVQKKAPAHGKLHAGDMITAVDGKKVGSDPQKVADLVTEREPGEKVTFSVIPAKKVKAAQKAGEKPGGEPEQVTVRTRKASEDGRAVVGIQPGTGHSFPFRIDIELADVGGPSAGLMFALGIADKLTPGDLTGGEFVAGTGTIDEAGRVGAIGGIRMKTIAAREKGAEYFLTPAGNCTSAAGDKPDGLTLVKTRTMHDAVESLEKIRSGDTGALPECKAG